MSESKKVDDYNSQEAGIITAVQNWPTQSAGTELLRAAAKAVTKRERMKLDLMALTYRNRK